MRILEVIRNRASTRNFLNRSIPAKVFQQILEAGIWGPSLAGVQPAKFIVVRNREALLKIAGLVKNELGHLGVVGRSLFVPSTLRALEACSGLIAIYSTHEFQDLIKKFSKYADKKLLSVHDKITERAEICAVSAAIQNMILQIEGMGLGSCWLHVPSYCERDINRILGSQDELVCLLAIGYPDTTENRSKRQLSWRAIKIVN